MKANIKSAQEYFSTDQLFLDTFAKYSPAYIVTNERLPMALKFMPNDTENVLTVAASGDHPLFIASYDIQHIDTFDISYNAKLLMDIKTLAIPLLDYRTYSYLLGALCVSKDITSVPHMSDIVKQLPLEERIYIKKIGLSAH